MRLAKLLAHGGIASRRGAERLIVAGRVRVSGEVVRDPATDVEEGDEVSVDGRPVEREPREVWMLNKPPGVVSTADDPGGRPTVVELVASERRLYPVGRLDADSSGLILLSNDGELANRLTHPRYEVPKRYRVRLDRAVTEPELNRLATGVELEDGPTAPAKIVRCGRREIEIEIHEGRNRQVRRMAEVIGRKVERLRRVGFGSLELEGLAEGEARRLGPAELGRLWKDAGDG